MSLSQKQKLHLTSGFALFLQVFMMIYGFVLPRLFLEFYGSAVNGLVSSIAQFLGFVTLAECGVGAVVQSALYKPLANKNLSDLSKIVVSAEKFFRNVAKILLLYTIILAFVFPNIINSKFDFIYTASLIVIISISSFAQYYFGITYRLLLNSDQFGFVPIIVQIFALALNLVASIFLMKFLCTVHVLKLASSFVFLIQPLAISFIANRWYHIDRNCKSDEVSIPQKWNGLAQHFSTVVLQSSGIVILTIFSTLENVSVYAVYNLVVVGVRSLTMSFTNGMQAFLGNAYAKGDMMMFRKRFDSFEWLLHFVVSLVFSVTATLIVPFVSVYTKGIHDVNYVVPIFGMMLTLAWGMYCIRLPYNIAVLAVGHYKQTQWSAVIEAFLNIFMAIIFVSQWGITGVACATFIAMVYRICYLAWYISRKIINRSLLLFLKHIFVDLVSVFVFAVMLYLVSGPVYEINVLSYYEWIVLAVKVTVIGMVTITIVNSFFYFERIKNLIRKK